MHRHGAQALCMYGIIMISLSWLMRRPDICIDTYHHIVTRGVRSLPFLHDKTDWWHCVQLLYFLNDSHNIRNWKRVISKQRHGVFHRPKHWPQREPITKILAFALHENHLHLIAKETTVGGISTFMNRFGDSMSRSYNRKYGGAGTIF